VLASSYPPTLHARYAPRHTLVMATALCARETAAAPLCRRRVWARWAARRCFRRPATPSSATGDGHVNPHCPAARDCYSPTAWCCLVCSDATRVGGCRNRIVVIIRTRLAQGGNIRLLTTRIGGCIGLGCRYVPLCRCLYMRCSCSGACWGGGGFIGVVCVFLASCGRIIQSGMACCVCCYACRTQDMGLHAFAGDHNPP